MTAPVRFPITPAVLTWAIQNGESSRAQLSQTFPKLSEWLSGDVTPTLNQVHAFSQKTAIPFGYLLLPTPPEEDIPVLHFRTINNTRQPPSRALIDTIQEMRHRQEWMREYLIDNGQDTPLAFVGAVSVQANVQAIARQVRGQLDLTRRLDGLPLSHFLSFLRRQIENQGILVMQNGVVGNHNRRKLQVAEFRAFVLVDGVAPLIFINRNDAPAASVFSLVHEFVHVLLNMPEVLNADPDHPALQQNERWVNEVTAEVLMPAARVAALFSENSAPTPLLLTRGAQQWHVSPLALAVKARQLDLIDTSALQQLRASMNTRAGAPRQAGGDYYRTRLARLDRHFAYAVIDAERSGSLSYTDAAQLVGVSLKSYPTFVEKYFEGEGLA